jgi:hypothetical protein
MSTELTLAQIQAAQDNDLAGIAAVVAEMDSRLDRLAAQTAGTMATNPARYSDFVADFRQDASVALFEALPRWEGDSVDDFRAFVYRFAATELKAKAHAERNAGVDRDALSTFKAMVELAKGDVYEAERLAQTKPAAGKRLSADRARAARISWQGTTSLDASRGGDSDATLADTLVAPTAEPEEIRPKVGHGAAREALSVLERYIPVPKDSEARSIMLEAFERLAAEGPSAYYVNVLEEWLTVPQDAQQRRYVLDAMAILRSAVSTAADGDLAEELRDASDDGRDARAQRIGAVRAALADVRTSRRVVLLCSFGIDGNPEFGWGDGSDREGLAAHLSYTLGTCKVNLSQARSEFAQAYIALVARTEDEAQALAAAAAEMRKHGGRK